MGVETAQNRPKTHPKWWGAKRPTILDGFWTGFGPVSGESWARDRFQRPRPRLGKCYTNQRKLAREADSEAQKTKIENPSISPTQSSPAYHGSRYTWDPGIHKTRLYPGPGHTQDSWMPGTRIKTRPWYTGSPLHRAPGCPRLPIYNYAPLGPRRLHSARSLRNSPLKNPSCGTPPWQNAEGPL